ncbi:hypothetical protein K443DRAFT_9274 [Laccaria amethystina LaAM-08-1]|uniref:Uncharacterized protein n=1 Tax=Laccaria amethystina LaAM-08-1 TaxID=1095629 RepID=A0A0C9WZK3_9AGAR|nr:hypothetical protein K443DRAFT_9274 [Laccaria amethystina LaAM-08-1]
MLLVDSVTPRVPTYPQQPQKRQIEWLCDSDSDDQQNDRREKPPRRRRMRFASESSNSKTVDRPSQAPFVIVFVHISAGGSSNRHRGVMSNGLGSVPVAAATRFTIHVAQQVHDAFTYQQRTHHTSQDLPLFRLWSTHRFAPCQAEMKVTNANNEYAPRLSEEPHPCFSALLSQSRTARKAQIRAPKRHIKRSQPLRTFFAVFAGGSIAQYIIMLRTDDLAPSRVQTPRRTSSLLTWPELPA